MGRTNLCKNPSFAYLLQSWSKIVPASIRVGADPAPWGTHARQSPQYLAVDVPPDAQGPIAAPEPVTIAGGQVLAVSALVRTSPGLAVTVTPEWTVNARPALGQVPSLLASSTDGTRPTWAFTAPTGATAARLRFEARTTSTKARGNLPGWVYIDDVMIVTAATPHEAITDAATFFDGDTPQRRIGYSKRALSHEWTGTRGLSASREVETDLDMSSTLVAVVDSGQARRVQIVVPARLAPKGAHCRLMGRTAAGFTWTPRAGVWEGDGLQRVIADALAPINAPITYTLQAGSGVVAESTPVVRQWQGLSLLTDTSGAQGVNLLWQGTDQRELKLRVTEHEVPGRSTPLVVYAPAMGEGTVSVTARTNLRDTPAMKVLMATPTPVALFHNPAHCVQCSLGTCDVDPVTVMAVTSASMERAPRIDVAERTWTVKGVIVGLPQPNTPLALSTWADLDARRIPWNTLDARNWTWEQFDRNLWQEDA